MRKYDLSINGSRYEVIIKEITPQVVRAEVNGEEHTVTINEIQSLPIPGMRPSLEQPPEAAPAAAKTGKKPATASPISSAAKGRITAPLPGQIRSILVREGDKVTTGQKLLVMEAMKLENKIAATSDGIVQKILVRDGDTVNQGQELVVIV